MKKPVLVVVAIAVAVAWVAWVKRIDIVLGVVKLKAQHSYEVAPNRPIVWQQGPLEADVPASERPPNVILIVADDLGINDVSTYGGGLIETPGIDDLAARGASFTQAYSGAASCAPSRAMLLTGRYPTRTGFEFTPTPEGMGKIATMIAASTDSGLPPVIVNENALENPVPFEAQGLPGDEVTLAEMLKAKGYRTGHIGKWHLGRAAGFRPEDQGFDESLLMHSGLYLPENDPNVVNAKLPFDPIDQFLWAQMRFAAAFNDGGPVFAPKCYITDYWTDESIKFIKANKKRPFFLYLAHWGPHTPLQATKEDYEAVGDIQPHRARVYAAMIRAVDRSVRRVMESLDEEGLADNTIVMFTSDNGGAGYIGLPEVNAPYRGWKLNMFEGGIRVPLLLHWPTQVPAGQKIDTPAAHIDFLPTLIEAAGVSLPDNREIDGVNLLPLVTGIKNPDWKRESLFWQSGHYQVVRHNNWKLQIFARPQNVLLYNLADDPTEQHNLAASEPAMVARLLALNEEHQAGRRSSLYPNQVEIPVAVDKTGADRAQPDDLIMYWPN